MKEEREFAAESRRVRLTKKCMKDALMEMLETTPISRISVTDLCERADVNRSSFYAYYADVYALLHDIEDEVLSQLPVNTPDDGPEFVSALENFFRYIRANERVFRVLMFQPEESFNERLMQFVIDHFESRMRINDGVMARYACIYCTTGVIGIVKHWIKSNFRLGCREFAEIVMRMSLQAIDI